MDASEIIDALKSMVTEERERERYVPHADTCKVLMELWLDPRAMGAPFIMGRRMADECIKRGMHPSDILVMDKLPAFNLAPDQQISIPRRKGKGARKSGRANRWNGRAI
jgi:hypothetical protein